MEALIIGETQEREDAAISVAENEGDDDEHQWESPIPFQLVYTGSPLLMQEDDILKYTDIIYRQMIFRFSNHYPHTPDGFNKLKNDLVAAAKPSGVQLSSNGSNTHTKSGSTHTKRKTTHTKSKSIICNCTKASRYTPRENKPHKRPIGDKACPFRFVIYQDQ
jgi:hypothetical protein